jgi:hypothetical protein
MNVRSIGTSVPRPSFYKLNSRDPLELTDYHTKYYAHELTRRFPPGQC